MLISFMCLLLQIVVLYNKASKIIIAFYVIVDIMKLLSTIDLFGFFSWVLKQQKFQEANLIMVLEKNQLHFFSEWPYFLHS